MKASHGLSTALTRIKRFVLRAETSANQRQRAIQHSQMLVSLPGQRLWKIFADLKSTMQVAITSFP